MLKIADKELEKLGFKKVLDVGYIVCFEREEEAYGFTHRLDFYYKNSGKHIVSSYEKNVNSNGFNNAVGLTYLEMKWATRKLKELQRSKSWKKKKSIYLRKKELKEWIKKRITTI